jgi:hypothetical protein
MKEESRKRNKTTETRAKSLSRNRLQLSVLFPLWSFHLSAFVFVLCFIGAPNIDNLIGV